MDVFEAALQDRSSGLAVVRAARLEAESSLGVALRARVSRRGIEWKVTAGDATLGALGTALAAASARIRTALGAENVGMRWGLRL